MERIRDEYVQMRAERCGFSDLYAAEFDRALAQRDARSRAEAWDEGRAVERMYASRVADYHHWSSISSGPPTDPPNPYRADRIEAQP